MLFAFTTSNTSIASIITGADSIGSGSSGRAGRPTRTPIDHSHVCCIIQAGLAATAAETCVVPAVHMNVSTSVSAEEQLVQVAEDHANRPPL
jgi:hypothetical protein